MKLAATPSLLALAFLASLTYSKQSSAEPTGWVTLQKVGCGSTYCQAALDPGFGTFGSALGCEHSTVRWPNATDADWQKTRMILEAESKNMQTWFTLNGCMGSYPTFTHFDIRNGAPSPSKTLDTNTASAVLKSVSCDDLGNCYLRKTGGNIGPSNCASDLLYWRMHWENADEWLEMALSAHERNVKLDVEYYTVNASCLDPSGSGASSYPTVANMSVQLIPTLDVGGTVWQGPFTIEAMADDSDPNAHQFLFSLSGNADGGACIGSDVVLRQAYNGMFSELFASAMTAFTTQKEVFVMSNGCAGSVPRLSSIKVQQ